MRTVEARSCPVFALFSVVLCDRVWSVYAFTVEDCMKRWKALRERFAREAKKKKKKSGDPADNSPPWSYYDQLLFLKEFIKHRKYVNKIYIERCIMHSIIGL